MVNEISNEAKERQREMGKYQDMMRKEAEKRCMSSEDCFKDQHDGHFVSIEEYLRKPLSANSYLPDLKELNVDLIRLATHFTIDDDHKWGYQIRMVNTEEYCAKLLVLTDDVPGSLHYHEKKKETFIVLQGKVQILVRPGHIPRNFVPKLKQEVRLEVGGGLTFRAGCPHQMKALEIPTIILEVSTHDDDEDIVRV